MTTRPALRFLRSWLSPPSGLQASEVEIPSADGGSTPGTLVSAGGSRERRGWIVLHGMTRPGRAHPELVRFVRALASTGGAVLVPEVRDWIELRFAPERSRAILGSAVRWLSSREGIAPGGAVLVGFSFGAPQALAAASDPDLSPRVRGVVSWGGYADVERVFRFALTGEHEWEGTLHRSSPDPYGRWIMGANCIPAMSPGAHLAVVDGLFALAREAGDRRVRASHPLFEPLRERLRTGLSDADRALFDVFAPVRGDPDRSAAEEILPEMVAAARREMPLIEPVPRIDRLDVPVRLLHGRGDALIPFTETLRAERMLAPGAGNLTTTITGLFAHSAGDAVGHPVTFAREGVRFVNALRGIFEIGGID